MRTALCEKSQGVFSFKAFGKPGGRKRPKRKGGTCPAGGWSRRAGNARAGMTEACFRAHRKGGPYGAAAERSCPQFCLYADAWKKGTSGRRRKRFLTFCPANRMSSRRLGAYLCCFDVTGRTGRNKDIFWNFRTPFSRRHYPFSLCGSARRSRLMPGGSAGIFPSLRPGHGRACARSASAEEGAS